MNKILIGVLSTAAAIVLSGCATTANTAKTPDAAVDAFLRDYVGVQFGDDISKINGFEDAQYTIPMKKKFQHFDKACVYYRKGTLFRVNVWTDIGKEYSQSSTEEQIRKSLGMLASELTLPEAYFDEPYMQLSYPAWGQQSASKLSNKKFCAPQHLTYCVKYATADLPNARRYCIDLIDTDLDSLLKSNKTATPQYKPVSIEMRKSWGIPLPNAQ